MKLRLALLLMCLFGTGLFASAQVKKKPSPKPVILNGPDAIPIVVTSTKKAHPRKPPPPPPAKLKAKPLPPPLIKKDKPAVPVKPTSAEFIAPFKVERLMANKKA